MHQLPQKKTSATKSVQKAAANFPHLVVLERGSLLLLLSIQAVRLVLESRLQLVDHTVKAAIIIRMKMLAYIDHHLNVLFLLFPKPTRLREPLQPGPPLHPPHVQGLQQRRVGRQVQAFLDPHRGAGAGSSGSLGPKSSTCASMSSSVNMEVRAPPSKLAMSFHRLFSTFLEIQR